MRHVQGESRQQSTLFPDTMDEYVSEDNSVRVIDAFVNSLDMIALEFTLANTKNTGRKPYHPADLLKLYLRVSQSSAQYSPIRKRMSSQCGSLMVNAKTDTRLQNHCEFSPAK